MSKDKKTTISVQGRAIAIVSQREADYISLTDIARYRDPQRTDYIIQNWMRNRNTIEFMGIWETLNNPGFKPIEFDGFRKQSGLNSFILTAKQWRDANPGLEGNMRDHAAIEQLLVLAIIEGMNAEFIRMDLAQSDRLVRLNQIAIRQLQSLTSAAKQLGKGKG